MAHKSRSRHSHPHAIHVPPPQQDWFSWFSVHVAHLAGRPVTFLVAAGLVGVWFASGPLFGFGENWQLIINTSTTIVTFLMVFLIQNTQNRDTMALQIKLAELLLVVRGASNRLATAEDLSEEDLEKLHDAYRKHADDMLHSLKRRKGRSRRRK